MPDQPPYQQQRWQETDSRTRTSDPPPASQTLRVPDAISDLSKESKSKSGFKVGEAKRTAGKAAEHNLSIEWIDVWVGNNRSLRFNVRTNSGNALEVHVEQAAYSKNYSGNGSLSTQVMPVAPIGTKGKLTARDATTEEVLEQPWTWIPLRGLGGLSLWNAIKKLFWKSDG
jgi:hypothetical protein